MLEKITNIFTKTEMTWKRVIITSVICGIVPGVIMSLSFLDGTSFQQIGISFEFWILAAMFIILNCEKPVEAGLKTFVFFLISQPLIYLVQVPFSYLGWAIFQYYPRWAILTISTLPGGMIAWFTKKNSWLSVLILSVANGILCFELPDFIHTLAHSFPRMLITAVFITWEVVFFVRLLFRENKKRIGAFALALLLLLGSGVLHLKNIHSDNGVYETMIGGNPPFEIVGEISGADVSIDGNTLRVKIDYYGGLPIDIKDADGNIFTVSFSCDADGAKWSME